MRKRIIASATTKNPATCGSWLDLETVAAIEVTSEDPSAPIERALDLGSAGGWRADGPGEQILRILFDSPQPLHQIRILFLEEKMERAQEFALGWASSEGEPMHEILRQQFNFSPKGATRELETFEVALEGVRVLELKITPDRSGGDAVASLAHLRVA